MLEGERVVCQNRTSHKSIEQLFHGNRCYAYILLHTCSTVYTGIIRSANKSINIEAKGLGEGGAPKFGPYRNLLLNRVYFFSLSESGAGYRNHFFTLEERYWYSVMF